MPTPFPGFWFLGPLRFHDISAHVCKALPAYLSPPEDRRDKTPLDLWLEAIDFSRIRTLQLNNTQGGYTLTEQVVEKLPQKLTSLESLMVHNQIAASFILALPKDSLKHLSWQNPGDSRGKYNHDHAGALS
jgi:hypothetical protein